MAKPAVPASSKRPSQEGRRGYAAGKRVKGRKRHIAADTMGLLPAFCGWRLHEQSDQLGAEHVRLEHAGDQAPSAAWFWSAAQALDCGENLCLAESIEKTEQGLQGHRSVQPKHS